MTFIKYAWYAYLALLGGGAALADELLEFRQLAVCSPSVICGSPFARACIYILTVMLRL
jgi:hypothetical protein